MTEQPDHTAPSHGSYWAVLRQHDFALFFAATTASTLGSAVVPVALTFALLSLGYSATAVGLVLAAQTAPTVVLMLAGGVIGDRWPRRRLMMGADILRCISQGMLAALLVLGHPPLVALMGLAACVGAGNAFFGPAESGLIPHVAGAERIKQANSLLSISGLPFGGARTFDRRPAGQSRRRSRGHRRGCAFLCRQRHLPGPDAGCRTREASQDVVHCRPAPRVAGVHQHRWLQFITVQYGLLNLVAFAPFFVLGPVLFAALPHGARLWGLVASATGVGGIVGGLLILRFRPLRPLVVFEIATALVTTPLVLLAFHTPILPLALGSAVFGAALAVLNVTVQTTIQERIPEEVLSRVNALFSMVAMSLGPLGFALCGPVAHVVGNRSWLAFGACVVLLSAVLLLASKTIRHLKNEKKLDAKI